MFQSLNEIATPYNIKELIYEEVWAVSQGDGAQADGGSDDEAEAALARQGDAVGGTSLEKANSGGKRRKMQHCKLRTRTRGNSTTRK